jgi:hypothetical protein|tara:strand:- start:141 stop:386 length:246 start_codon:yes stop_codon:yes gene_type:complete
MSFKFKLGEYIVPSLAREMGIPVGPSKVTAIQLDGYIEIRPIGTNRRHLVESEHYERYEEEIVEPDNQGDAFPTGWGIEEL